MSFIFHLFLMPVIAGMLKLKQNCFGKHVPRMDLHAVQKNLEISYSKRSVVEQRAKVQFFSN